MDIGISTMVFADCGKRGEPKDLYHAFSRLAEAGYRYLEYNDQSVPQPFSLLEADVRSIEKNIKKLGLIIESIHIPCTQLPEGDIGSLDKSLRARCVDICLRTMETCKRLKAKYAVLHAGGAKENLSDPDVFRRANEVYLESLKELCDSIGTDDLCIVLENVGSKLSSLEGIQDTIRTVGSPRLKICVDTGHALRMGFDPAQIIRKTGSLLRHLHIHDTVQGQDAHLVPGEGAVDWKQVALALKEVGYKDVFMLETVFSKYSNDPDIIARKCKEAAEAVLRNSV